MSERTALDVTRGVLELSDAEMAELAARIRAEIEAPGPAAA
jgi:hypothetical protein